MVQRYAHVNAEHLAASVLRLGPANAGEEGAPGADNNNESHG